MKKKDKNKIFIVLTIFTLIIITLGWSKKYFGHLDFEQILYLWFSDGQGGSFDFKLILNYLLYALPWLIILLFINKKLNEILNDKLIYKTKYFNKGKVIDFSFLLTKNTFNFLLVLTVIISLIGFDYNFEVLAFFSDKREISNLYEKYYVDPSQVNYKFPDQKQNLIYIVTESLENNFNEIIIDDQNVSLIENLSELSKRNISFSDSFTLGGAKQIRGLSWTAASLVGQTSGIPIQILNLDVRFGEDKGFLPGVTTLGEILEDNGYKNYFMAGSDANFGGRETYFKNHGNYEIFDIKYFKENDYLPEDYHIFWGFEDLKLFDFAKDKLLEISQNNQPFNFTMLTVDTHFPDGYTDEGCQSDYSIDYANAISCFDNNINNFLEWIYQQDFYENTTIVIIGDHYTMNNQFSEYYINEEKTIYNTIINSRYYASNKDTYFNRQFSVLDYFPTTLKSLGVDFDSNTLGLGTNLYSNEQTLIERLGLELLNEELAKYSNYYFNNFVLE